MRKYLVVFVVLSLLSIGSTAAAGPPEFPDFSPMDHGPEGVVVDNVGNVYVSVGVPGAVEIWRFSPTGEPDVLASMPAGPGQTATGMAISPNGKHIYAGVAFRGVFEFGLDGDFELVDGTDAIVLPNSLAFDSQGNLYITETFSFDPEDDGLAFYPACADPPFTGEFGRGGIWVVPENGSAELLMRHDLLTGLCLPNPIPYPIGANGLAYDHGSLVVANSERALLLEIEIGRDGELGEPEIISDIEGMGPFGPWLIDGLALDVHGDIYVAAVTGGAIVKVERDGSSTEVIGTFSDGLDFPASLAFGTGKGERQSLFVTNLSLGGPGFAGPGLVKIDAGAPGMPLP
jgi:sugar lactone lactonase YvrE